MTPRRTASSREEVSRGSLPNGAFEAWLADELGEERFGKAMVRGTQVSQAAGILGMPFGVALASIHLNLPMVAGGVLMLFFYLVLSIAMPETGVHPVHRETVSRLALMRATLGKGARMVRASTLTPVVWFGIINVGVSLAGIGATQLVHQRLNMTDGRALSRTLLTLNSVMIVGVIVFGLAHVFLLAVAAFGVARVIRRLHYPLYTAWLNGAISEPGVRATVLSLQGVGDALGQSIGGPLTGLVGTIFSLRAAITADGLLLLPALPLYGWSLRREQASVPVGEEVEQM